jgi:hypothetical protein
MSGGVTVTLRLGTPRYTRDGNFKTPSYQGSTTFKTRLRSCNTDSDENIDEAATRFSEDFLKEIQFLHGNGRLKTIFKAMIEGYRDDREAKEKEDS